jgi:hypothetical protein
LTAKFKPGDCILRYKVRRAQRLADEIILDDSDVMKMVKISKRKLQYLKAVDVIPIHKLKPDGLRTYYLLRDIPGILK